MAAMASGWLLSNIQQTERLLKVEAEVYCFGARAYEMRTAERRKEVVQGFLVGQVDDREAQAPLVTIAVEEVVVADGQVEKVPRCDARRILIVVLGAVGGNVDARGAA